jgi:glycopeptide antibiotics resistance protein
LEILKDAEHEELNLMDTFLEYTDWLYTVIYENHFFFFDYWSIVHFISGFLIFMALNKIKIKSKFATLFILLVAYEIIELIIREIGYQVFRPEFLIDQVTDLWVGMLGGLLGYFIIKIKS